MEPKAVTVTIWARGDNENSPADAVHHALMLAHKQGLVEYWEEPVEVGIGTVERGAVSVEREGEHQ